MKKLFSISLGIFLITLLFLGVYNFGFRNNPKNGIANEEKRAEQKAEEERSFSNGTQEKQFQQVTETPAFGATITSQNRIIYFYQGKLIQVSLNGGGGEAIIESLPGKLLRAVWSPDRDKALGLFQSSKGTRWHLIHLAEKTITPLKEGITNVSWAGIGDRIFYAFKSGEYTTLSSAKPDGTEWKEIGKSPIQNPYLETIPGSALLSFWNKPDGLGETSLFTIPITGGEAKKIFSGKFGANYSWSQNGERLLSSAATEKGGFDLKLGISNSTGGEYQTLQVPTLLSKTVWSKDSKTVYYALPTGIPDRSILPNDYFEKPIKTRDSFWKMDVETGKTVRIIEVADIPGDFDSIDLFLDQNEEFLFFTNRTDGKLYRIRLTSE